MTKSFFFALLTLVLLSSFSPPSNVWVNDDYHSTLGFTVVHLGVNDVIGVFTDFDVTVTTTKPNFSDAQFELVANTNTVTTLRDPRDLHLRSASFFDSEAYPTMKYKSTGIKKVKRNKYKLTGNLTIRNVTKEVVVDLEYKGKTENPSSKKTTVGLLITGVIRRSDFGVGNEFPSTIISDKVRIKAEGEFTLK